MSAEEDAGWSWSTSGCGTSSDLPRLENERGRGSWSILDLGVANGSDRIDAFGEGVVSRDDEGDSVEDGEKSGKTWDSMRLVCFVESGEGVWRGETLKIRPFRFDER